MAHSENPPFARGETFYGQSPLPAIDTNNLGGKQLEGTIWEFDDLIWNQAGAVGAKQARTNRVVKCMVVRNVSGIALLPGYLANLSITQTDGKAYCGQVDGYTTTESARGYPIDEFLPAAGVANNDLFYIVIDGPAMCKTDLAGGANNVFAVGGLVAALTAATSQATTAGRVEPLNLAALTTPMINAVINRVGHALSAATTANTNANLLVDVGHW